MQIGDIVKVVNIKPLPGNTVAPPLDSTIDYKVHNICYDKEGNPHIDLGLVSSYSYIRSYETKEELPDGHKIHWVHPSRLQVINSSQNT